MGYGYNRGYQGSRNYGNNYGNGYGGGYPRQQRKKSGCKQRQDKKGRPCITAWNKSRQRGFVTMVAVPCKKFETKSPNSDKWVATVQFPDGKKTFTAFFNTVTKKLTIPDLQMVANPNASNGGYFGTYLKRR